MTFQVTSWRYGSSLNAGQPDCALPADGEDPQYIKGLFGTVTGARAGSGSCWQAEQSASIFNL